MENFENLERAGAILTLIGVIWIAVLAFQAGDIFWGIFFSHLSYIRSTDLWISSFRQSR